MAGEYKIVSEEVLTSPKNRKHQLVDAVVQTPSGNEVVWQYIKTRSVVSIIALTDKNEIYCVRQWRPARKDYVWEHPAGGVETPNPSPEDIINNADRELQEEIGLKAGKIQVLASFSPSIHTDSTFYVVLATDLTTSKLPGDADEDLEIKAFPFSEAYDLLINQQTPSALTLVGMLLASQYLNGLQP